MSILSLHEDYYVRNEVEIICERVNRRLATNQFPFFIKYELNNNLKVKAWQNFKSFLESKPRGSFLFDFGFQHLSVHPFHVGCFVAIKSLLVPVHRSSSEPTGGKKRKTPQVFTFCEEDINESRERELRKHQRQFRRLFEGDDEFGHFCSLPPLKRSQTAIDFMDP